MHDLLKYFCTQKSVPILLGTREQHTHTLPAPFQARGRAPFQARSAFSWCSGGLQLQRLRHKPCLWVKPSASQFPVTIRHAAQCGLFCLPHQVPSRLRMLLSVPASLPAWRLCHTSPHPSECPTSSLEPSFGSRVQSHMSHPALSQQDFLSSLGHAKPSAWVGLPSRSSPAGPAQPGLCSTPRPLLHAMASADGQGSGSHERWREATWKIMEGNAATWQSM